MEFIYNLFGACFGDLSNKTKQQCTVKSLLNAHNEKKTRNGVGDFYV